MLTLSTSAQQHKVGSVKHKFAKLIVGQRKIISSVLTSY